jgi:hypothetical protein
MNDLFQLAPDDQKPKILKLLEIWERGQTFPREMLAGFKSHLMNKAKTSKDPSRFCGPLSTSGHAIPESKQQALMPGCLLLACISSNDSGSVLIL